MFGDVIDVLREMGYRARPGTDGIDALSGQADVLATGLKELAIVLDGRGIPGVPATVQRVSDDVLHEVAVRCLRQWGGEPSRERSVVAAVAAAEWIRLLDRLVGSLEAPVVAAAAAARVPWWR